MRKVPIMLGLLVAGTVTTAADGPGDFFYAPVPRWQDEPETEETCAAIRKECPALAGKEEIEAEVSFDELYDARGMLAGLRLTRSSGCKPLDEEVLVGHRHFRMAFHSEDKPDLDDTRLEAPDGVDMGKVRIVKSSGTTVSLGCNP